MEANAGILERINGVDRHVESIGRDLRDTNRTVEQHGRDITRLEGGLEDTDQAVQRLESAIREEGQKNRESNNRVIVALIGFALTAAGSAVTVAITLGASP